MTTEVKERLARELAERLIEMGVDKWHVELTPLIARMLRTGEKLIVDRRKGDKQINVYIVRVKEKNKQI